MSTQRREGRYRPASSMGRANKLEQAGSALFVRSCDLQSTAFSILPFTKARTLSGFFLKKKAPCRTSKWQHENRKCSGGGTAPPYRDRLATNSLQSDCLTTQLVRNCSGSCPSGPAVARQPSGQRFSGHPSRSSPPLPELRVSIRPCRVYPQR